MVLSALKLGSFSLSTTKKIFRCLSFACQKRSGAKMLNTLLSRFVKLRSTDSDGLRTLEARYGSYDSEPSESMDAAAAGADSGLVTPKGGRTQGGSAGGLESILAFAEFNGAKEDTPAMRAAGTGQGTSTSSGPPGALFASGLGRAFTWRRRDGCMWMRMRRRRRQDPNRFLDFLFQAPVFVIHHSRLHSIDGADEHEAYPSCSGVKSVNDSTFVPYVIGGLHSLPAVVK